MALRNYSLLSIFWKHLVWSVGGKSYGTHLRENVKKRLCKVAFHKLDLTLRRLHLLDTGGKLDIHKTFRRHPRLLIYVQFTSCVQGVNFKYLDFWHLKHGLFIIDRNGSDLIHITSLIGMFWICIKCNFFENLPVTFVSMTLIIFSSHHCPPYCQILLRYKRVNNFQIFDKVGWGNFGYKKR